jgi:hypothetical protein
MFNELCPGYTWSAVCRQIVVALPPCQVLWHSVQRFDNWWVLIDRRVLTLPWVTGYTRVSLYRTSTLFSTTSVFRIVTPCSLATAYRPFGRIWLRYKLVLRCFAHCDLCSCVSSRDTSVACSRTDTDTDTETYRRSAPVFGTTGALLGTKSAGNTV